MTGRARLPLFRVERIVADGPLCDNIGETLTPRYIL